MCFPHRGPASVAVRGVRVVANLWGAQCKTLWGIFVILAVKLSRLDAVKAIGVKHGLKPTLCSPQRDGHVSRCLIWATDDSATPPAATIKMNRYLSNYMWVCGHGNKPRPLLPLTAPTRSHRECRCLKSSVFATRSDDEHRGTFKSRTRRSECLLTLALPGDSCVFECDEVARLSRCVREHTHPEM